jgi:hypothetical protein
MNIRVPRAIAAYLTVSAALGGSPTVTDAQTPGPEVVGSWAPLYTLDLQAIHMVLLKNGKVLVVDDLNDPAKRFAVFHPATPSRSSRYSVLVTHIFPTAGSLSSAADSGMTIPHPTPIR